MVTTRVLQGLDEASARSWQGFAEPIPLLPAPSIFVWWGVLGSQSAQEKCHGNLYQNMRLCLIFVKIWYFRPNREKSISKNLQGEFLRCHDVNQVGLGFSQGYTSTGNAVRGTGVQEYGKCPQGYRRVGAPPAVLGKAEQESFFIIVSYFSV